MRFVWIKGGVYDLCGGMRSTQFRSSSLVQTISYKMSNMLCWRGLESSYWDHQLTGKQLRSEIKWKYPNLFISLHTIRLQFATSGVTACRSSERLQVTEASDPDAQQVHCPTTHPVTNLLWVEQRCFLISWTSCEQTNHQPPAAYSPPPAPHTLDPPSSSKHASWQENSQLVRLQPNESAETRLS